MSEIPKEVMATAMRALSVPEHEMVDSVAHAILAERKRCANVAKKARNDAEFYGNTDMMRAATLIAYRIGAAA